MSTLPSCPFCNGAFKRGGGSFSPGSSQESSVCCGCLAFGQQHQHAGGALFSVLRRDACTQDAMYPDTLHYPEAWSTWINSVLLPTWRNRASEIETHKNVEFQMWLAEVFYPKFPQLKGLSHFTDTTISYHDCPEEAQVLYDVCFGGPKECPQYGRYLPLPERLRLPVYPPKAPSIKGVFLYYRVDDTWLPVNPAESAEQVVPEDPILVGNRTFFEDVWRQLSENGIRLPEIVETKNEYGGIEPWYMFHYLAGALVPFRSLFTVGWRHRVVNIRLETSQSIPVAGIAALAAQDNVTFHTDREAGAMSTTVHAWGKDKTIEYLYCLFKAIQEASEAVS